MFKTYGSSVGSLTPIATGSAPKAVIKSGVTAGDMLVARASLPVTKGPNIWARISIQCDGGGGRVTLVQVADVEAATIPAGESAINLLAVFRVDSAPTTDLAFSLHVEPLISPPHPEPPASVRAGGVLEVLQLSSAEGLGFAGKRNDVVLGTDLPNGYMSFPAVDLPQSPGAGAAALTVEVGDIVCLAATFYLAVLSATPPSPVTGTFSDRGAGILVPYPQAMTWSTSINSSTSVMGWFKATRAGTVIPALHAAAWTGHTLGAEMDYRSVVVTGQVIGSESGGSWGLAGVPDPTATQTVVELAGTLVAGGFETAALMASDGAEQFALAGAGALPSTWQNAAVERVIPSGEVLTLQTLAFAVPSLRIRERDEMEGEAAG